MSITTDTSGASDDNIDRILIGAGDRAACRAAIRGGSKTFHAASLLLPARIREPALALYAFCRLADDAVDESGDPVAALDDLHERLELAAAGRPRAHPSDRALAATLEAFSIPIEIPDALLEGFAWDAARRRYDTLTDLEHYAMRVAGTVGLMMSLVMGARGRGALARAADLGIAMQLSNIARDVGEDARAGRLYLPLQWLAEEGVDAEEFLAAPACQPALQRVVARILARAAQLYDRAAQGVAELPVDCRPAIHAARLMYAEIGREVARRNYDSVSQRAVVPVSRKLTLVARALTAAAWPGGRADQLALPAAAPLVDLVCQLDAVRPVARGAAARSFGDQLVSVLDLFERLERRDRFGTQMS
jgi:phytoene synthase